MASKLSILLIVWYPFGINFLYISQIPENSYFAICIMRNACFCYFRPPILVHKSSFSIHIPGHPFKFYDDFMWNWSIFGPLQNPVGAKIRRHPPVSGVVKYKRPDFSPNEKISKSQACQNRYKSQKKIALDVQCFNIDEFLATFRPPFSIDFPDLNLLNCNKYFFTIWGLPFWHQK